MEAEAPMVEDEVRSSQTAGPYREDALPPHPCHAGVDLSGPEDS
jgi:hypothetical protein